MRDETTFVEQLHRDLREVRWPEPAEIRARARRRSRRTAVLAAVAVLVVVSASAVAVGDRSGRRGLAPAASPSRAAAPVARVEIPPAALLQQDDLTARSGLQLSEAGLGGTVDVGMALRQCATRRDSGVPAQETWVSRSQTVLRPATGGGRLGDVLVVQDLHRMRDDGAARFFDGLRRQLTVCREWREVRSIEWGGESVTVEDVHRWDVPRRDFAGDESLLLRHSVAATLDPADGQVPGHPSTPDATVVVRVGDLVSVLILEPTAEADLVRLAGLAARRMCAAANPSC
ncbi:hypothetical protein AB0B83_10260 [Micromonospora sp. NPDC049060]|uniref:hypothetical protein n=1 Tax=Micromonospora sp. NPDC049060 TaxID=3154828 RepID=UPI00340A4595